MREHSSKYPIEKMARILRISRSGYYKYLSRGKTKRSQENEILSKKIKEIFEKTRKRYGSPRITDELHEMGFKCSKNRVARLMKELDLISRRRKKYKIKTTDSDHELPISPNLLNRNFKVNKPNKVWVSDITYVHTMEGWLFLCIIIDLYSRKIVGWSMKDHMRASLVIDALKMAYNSRRPGRGLIFHSDRGVQYASKDFRLKLTAYKMISSMSRKGNCWDNAVSESFFHSLKTELIHHQRYETRGEAKQDIFEYIEVFYNRERIHSANNYLSPVDYEIQQKAA